MSTKTFNAKIDLLGDKAKAWLLENIPQGTTIFTNDEDEDDDDFDPDDNDYSDLPEWVCEYWRTYIKHIERKKDAIILHGVTVEDGASVSGKLYDMSSTEFCQLADYLAEHLKNKPNGNKNKSNKNN